MSYATEVWNAAEVAKLLAEKLDSLADICVNAGKLKDIATELFVEARKEYFRASYLEEADELLADNARKA